MSDGRLYRAASGLFWRTNEASRTVSRRVLGPAVRMIVEEEARAWSRFEMPLRRRLWLWRHGFLSQADVIYDVDERTRHQYLSAYQRELTRPINGRWCAALENKLLFHRLLDSFDSHRSVVYGHLDRGRFTPVDTPETEPTARGSDGSPAAVDATATADAATRVTDWLEATGRLVLKPVHGVSGNRIFVCSSVDGSYHINGEETSPAAFGELVSSLDEYLVCEFVEQADYAAELYPESANTLRVLTMFDPDMDEPFIAAAAHRIGTNRSAPLDNWSRGGLSAAIDLSTGELSEGVQYPYDGCLERHATHPDTGAAIAGARVPDWPAIREGIETFAAGFPQLPYVGWDLIVTGPGEFTVIEGNECSGVRLFQVHRPLLADPRVRRFYEHHGVV
jgi:hypothetical protein